MERRGLLRGFTVWEILAVVAALVVLAIILFPLPHGDREFASDTVCASQLRQLGMALQMYAQDHGGQYPAAGKTEANWDTVLSGYVGSPKIFICPRDRTSDITVPNSYAYNGLLLRADGSGVNEAQVRVPTEVGAFCDAEPTRLLGHGGVIGGGGLLPAICNATPANRHRRGLVMAYVDGHTRYIPLGAQARDVANPFTHAFTMAGALGLVDNPVGGMMGFTPATSHPETATLVVGGDFCTRQLLWAAALAWKQRTGTQLLTKGFRGQYATKGRPAAYVWGIADGRKPAGHSYPIARDAVVVIVNKNCKINWTRDGHHLPIAKQMAKGTYWANSAQVAAMFGAETGHTATAFVGYTYNTNSGTRRFFTQGKWWGKPLSIGAKAVTVADDWEMLEKVAADPYGVGYCSAAAADLDRVGILCLQPGSDRYNPETAHCFPTADDRHRWTWQASPGDWPLMRTLYAECGGKAWGPNGIADTMFKHGAPGWKAMLRGPWFQASYWPE